MSVAYDTSTDKLNPQLRIIEVMFWAVTMLWLVACGGNDSGEGQQGSAPINPQNNTAPLFTSPNSVTVPENFTAITHVNARDPENDPITYNLVGGLDMDLFDIHPQTGELRFKQPVDFEAPSDSNQNNQYIVEVAATDGISKTLKNWYVTVTGVGLTVEVRPNYIKTLSFSWNPFNESKYYKLFVNLDGASGYTQVGTDLTTTHVDIGIPVHMTSWIDSRYVVEGYGGLERVFRSEPKGIRPLELDTIGYVKGSSTDLEDRFGESIALSADGQTLAVGVPGEDSGAAGIGSDYRDNSVNNSGAVYMFTRGNAVWTLQAHIKASNVGASDEFGTSVALSADGRTLVVGAKGESSEAMGVGGDQNNDAADQAGAVYVYERSGIAWSQQIYIKASNTDAGDRFGVSVTLDADGQTLVVGAQGESSATTGVNGNQGDNSVVGAGAVYVFTRVGLEWTQQAYIKASNTDGMDFFGVNVALSADGRTLAVGAWGEDSGVTEGNIDQRDNNAVDSGAVYIFTRDGTVWAQQAFIKASNAEGMNFDLDDYFGDAFGQAVALSSDGTTLVVGAPYEDSAATGVEGNQQNNMTPSAGAVYVYTRAQTGWSQQAYIKASNTDTEAFFGISVALSTDGNTLTVGSWGESSNASGIDGDQRDSSADNAGAVYVYERQGAEWARQTYIKAPNTDKEDYFGMSVAMSANGQILVVGAPGEDSASTGIDGDQVNNEVSDAGAVFLY